MRLDGGYALRACQCQGAQRYMVDSVGTRGAQFMPGGDPFGRGTVLVVECNYECMPPVCGKKLHKQGVRLMSNRGTGTGCDLPPQCHTLPLYNCERTFERTNESGPQRATLAGQLSAHCTHSCPHIAPTAHRTMPMSGVEAKAEKSWKPLPLRALAGLAPSFEKAGQSSSGTSGPARRL